METNEEVVSIEDTMSNAYDKIMGIEEDSQPDTPEEASVAVEEEPTGPAEEDTQIEPVDPPASWTAEAKELFNQLPPELQKAVSEREAQREKAINQSKAEAAELRKSYSGIESVTQKHGQYLQHLGMSADVAFDTLLTAEHTLRNGTPQQKMQVVQQISQDYGIPLNGVQSDPNQQVSQLVQEINTLKQELGGFKQQQQEAVMKEKTAMIESFAAETDANGNPLRPYFNDVAEMMVKLKQAGVAETLDDLYEKACLHVPEVKQKIEAKSKEEIARKEAEKAKKAKSEASTKSRGVPRDMVARSESMEDTLARVYDEVNG